MTDSCDVSTFIETHAELEVCTRRRYRCSSRSESLPRNSRFVDVCSTGHQAICSRTTQRMQLGSRTRHLTAAKRILRYLKKTKNFKLEYKRTGKKLQGFVDSDWANEKNRKSVGGYNLSLGGAAVYWASKKQTLVALSTEEAEYTAFTEGNRELPSDIGTTDPDNAAAITIYYMPTTNPRRNMYGRKES